MFSSCARVLTTDAPMRRPVKEPGPDMKVISVRSLQVLPFSASLLSKNCKSFSARLLPRSSLYSLLFSLRIASGVLVSKYNFINEL